MGRARTGHFASPAGFTGDAHLLTEPGMGYRYQP
jgi:hypothetical protein